MSHLLGLVNNLAKKLFCYGGILLLPLTYLSQLGNSLGLVGFDYFKIGCPWLGVDRGAWLRLPFWETCHTLAVGSIS